nr:hypothetical protein [Tanacetum cinerariifolium]
MVAYLKKPTGSEGFQEIVDFLNGSHIRYALTRNLTIYVSIIKKFWQTATVRTFDNGEYTPLFPSMLAIQAEEGEGSGHPFEPQPLHSTAQPTNEEPIPNVASSSRQKTQTHRQALSKVTELPQTSEPIPNVAYEAVYEEWDGKVERDATTSNNLPLSRGHTLGSGEDSIELIKELMETYTKLFERVLALEESKTAQDLVITRLELRVKKLEKKKKKERNLQPLKRRLFKFSAKGEVHSQEYQPEDQLGVLSAAKVLADAARKNVQTYTRRRMAVSTASRLFSTIEESVSTADASMPVSTVGMVQEVNIPSPVVVKDKGKGKMDEFEDEQSKRTKLQQEQDRLGYEAAVRLGRASELAAKSSHATNTDFAEVGSSKRAAKAELNYKEAYKFFDDMLKAFDKDDLVMLWSLVKERFSYMKPTDEKERTLWVELKRLFEPDTDDTLWKLQRERNGYFHAGRERISIVKRDSDFDVG